MSHPLQLEAVAATMSSTSFPVKLQPVTAPCRGETACLFGIRTAEHDVSGCGPLRARKVAALGAASLTSALLAQSCTPGPRPATSPPPGNGLPDVFPRRAATGRRTRKLPAPGSLRALRRVRQYRRRSARRAGGMAAPRKNPANPHRRWSCSEVTLGPRGGRGALEPRRREHSARPREPGSACRGSGARRAAAEGRRWTWSTRCSRRSPALHRGVLRAPPILAVALPAPTTASTSPRLKVVSAIRHRLNFVDCRERRAAGRSRNLGFTLRAGRLFNSACRATNLARKSPSSGQRTAAGQRNSSPPCHASAS